MNRNRRSYRTTKRRSSLHRCLQRHSISRLPDIEGDKPARKTFKAYPVGFSYRYCRGPEGKVYLHGGIDRTSKFAFVALVGEDQHGDGSAFLDALVTAVPYKVNIVLADNVLYSE